MELSLDNLSLDDNSNLPNSDCRAKPFSLLSDGQILHITPKATEMCIFLQTGFEFREMAAQDLSEPFEIHEDLADPEILKLIVDFCEEYKDEPEEEDMSPMEWSSYYKIHKPLLHLDKDTIFRLVNAADALQIPRLYKSVCSFIVKKYIDLKTPEEIRKTFWDIDEEDKCEASEGVTEVSEYPTETFWTSKEQDDEEEWPEA